MTKKNMETDKRSLAEVERIMGHAKLEKSDLKPTVQCLHFTEELDNDAFKLIEINQDILQCFEEGQCITIRGDKTESAVLCTDSKTYDVKEQETSNYLLLVPQLKPGTDLPPGTNTHVCDTEITSIHQKYYELKEIKPRLKKMQSFLHENVFSGTVCEEDEQHQGNKYRYEDLLDIVQASGGEITIALKKLEACLIDGYWRIIDFDFKGEILGHIIKLIDEENWGFDKIPVKQCCDVLEELYLRNVVEHVLKGFSSDIEKDEDDHEFCRISEDKVCRYFAELILKPTEKFNLKEFLNVWQDSVPSGLQTGLYQLESMALIDRESSPEVIRFFPVENLPEDVNDRFQVLFKTKVKWTANEIMPYIEDLSTAKMKASALLTKYARASTQNGIKFYNSKKPIS